MEKNNECMKICIFSEFKAAQSNFLEKIRKNRADLLLRDCHKLV